MGRSQRQGLPRVALADVPACSASPRGICAMNEAPACDAPAHSLPPARPSAWEPGREAVCRAAGCRNRSGPLPAAGTEVVAGSFRRWQQLRIPIPRAVPAGTAGRGCRSGGSTGIGIPRGIAAPGGPLIPATASCNGAQPTVLLPPPPFVSCGTRGQKRGKEKIFVILQRCF